MGEEGSTLYENSWNHGTAKFKTDIYIQTDRETDRLTDRNNYRHKYIVQTEI